MGIKGLAEFFFGRHSRRLPLWDANSLKQWEKVKKCETLANWSEIRLKKGENKSM